MIPDTDDIFIFPHLVTDHKRLVTFDLGANEGLGSGGMIFGSEKFTFGAFAHRSDFLGAVNSAFNTIGDVANVGDHGTSGSFGAGPSLGALNWIDAMMGWQAGGMPWGLRYSMGRNVSEHGTTKNSVTSVNAVLGTHLNAVKADASAEFSYATAKTDSGGITKGSPFGFSLAARSTPADQSDNLVLGWLGNIDYEKLSLDVTPTGATAAATTDFSRMNFIAGVGPVYKPNDRTNVAMYGTFEFESSKTTPPSPGVEEKLTTLTIPGWNIAAEMDVASWLQVRAGLRSSFTFNKGEPGPDKTNDHPFMWTSGVGIHLNNLQIDGYLDPRVVTTGTDLLGNNSATFGLVTASYHF